jgi:hypothetical protein
VKAIDRNVQQASDGPQLEELPNEQSPAVIRPPGSAEEIFQSQICNLKSAISNLPVLPQLFEQIDHFDRCECGFVTFVANFAAGAVQSLVHGFAGDDAEGHGDASFFHGRHDA